MGSATSPSRSSTSACSACTSATSTWPTTASSASWAASKSSRRSSFVSGSTAPSCACSTSATDVEDRRRLASTIFFFLLTLNGAIVSALLIAAPALSSALLGSADYTAALRLMLLNTFAIGFTFIPVPRAADGAAHRHFQPADAGPGRPDDDRAARADREHGPGCHGSVPRRRAGHGGGAGGAGAVVRAADPGDVLAGGPARRAHSSACRGCPHAAGAADHRRRRQVRPETVRHHREHRRLLDGRQLRAGREAVPERLRIGLGSVLLRDDPRARRAPHVSHHYDLRCRGPRAA